MSFGLTDNGKFRLMSLGLTNNVKFELGPLGAFGLTNKEKFTLGPRGPSGPLKCKGLNSGPWVLTTSDIPVKKKVEFTFSKVYAHSKCAYLKNPQNVISKCSHEIRTGTRTEKYAKW